MGNSAGKDHGGLAVSEAMQTLLEGPATSVFEEEGGVWDSVFASREMDADAFFEASRSRTTLVVIRWELSLQLFVLFARAVFLTGRA